MLEVVRGRNSKGNWPAKAASKLRHVSAIIELPDRSATNRFIFSETAANKALKFTRYGPNSIWLEGILAGTDELGLMVKRMIPGAVVLDAEAKQVTAGCLNNPAA